MKACRTVIQRALEPVHSEKVLTQVIAAGRAERAGAAWHDEGSYNPRSHPRTIRAGAKGNDGSRDLMSEDSRGGERHFALDDVEICMTDATGMNTNESLSCFWLGNGYPLDLHRARHLVEESRRHHFHTLHPLL